jgi:hypothetical protein
MSELRRFDGGDLILFLVVLAVAAGARIWYLMACADNAHNSGPLQVQDASPLLAELPAGTELHGRDKPTEQDALIHNLKEHHWFGSLAPLASAEEKTAHVSPGYPWLLAWLEQAPLDLSPMDRTVRWIQCGLGALTAGLYFLFAFQAFGSRLAATLSGLFCALHPYWIINTAEIDDGVLTAFLLAASLFLGSKGSQSGGAFASVLFGLALAGLSLVRAALLPFAVMALVWFLLRCRTLRLGWLCATVAALGFLSALAPWTIRNVQEFGEPIPIADSTYLHLWIGNNAKATGGPQDEQTMLKALAEARGEDPKKTLQEFGSLKQPERYARLGRAVWESVANDPAATLQHRLESTVGFFLSESWLKDRKLWRRASDEAPAMPEWLEGSYPAILEGTLLGMLLLGVLGWRWTYGWRQTAMPSSLALICVPLPYLLSHAESLHGPRLPLDGVLLCYGAFAVACVVTAVDGVLFRGVPPRKPTEDKPQP